MNTHDPKDIGLSAQAMKFPGSKTRPPTRLKRQVKFLSTWLDLGRDRVSYHSKINCILCIVKLPQRVGPTHHRSYKFQERPTKTMKNVGEKHAILIGEPPAIDQRPPPHVAGARPKMVGKLHTTWEENITHSHIPEK